jgi:hypothetical protein
VLCLFVPLWSYSQRETIKATEAKEKRAAERETVLAEISA